MPKHPAGRDVQIFRTDPRWVGSPTGHTIGHFILDLSERPLLCCCNVNLRANFVPWQPSKT